MHCPKGQQVMLVWALIRGRNPLITVEVTASRVPVGLWAGYPGLFERAGVHRLDPVHRPASGTSRGPGVAVGADPLALLS